MSYFFNGNDQFYTGTLPFTVMPASDGLTLVAWVKITAAMTGTNAFVDYGNTTNVNNFYRLNGNATQNVLALNDKASATDSNSLASPTLATDTWSMLAAVFTDDDNTGLGSGTATSRRAYLNGTLDTNDTSLTSTIWTDIASTGQITIGGSAAFTLDVESGYIAHVQIYDKALSEAELDELYSGTNPVAAATEADLVAYWPLVSDYVAERGGTLSLNSAPTLYASDNPTVDDPPASISITTAPSELAPSFNYTVTGTGFGASQGAAGNVYIAPTDSVADANKVTQTIASWSDTSIVFTATRGSLNYNTNMYLFVKENGGTSNTSGSVLQYKPGVTLSWSV